MEGNTLSRTNVLGNASYGGFDLQGPMRVHHHNSRPRKGSSMVHSTFQESFPLTIGSTQDCDQSIAALADCSKLDKGKCASDEDEPSFMEDASDGRNDPNKGKKVSPWQRVKWTDTMVRLLITAVSYINEEMAAEYVGGARRKTSNLQKKGKWKSVSKVMAERGHFVSPQQCEDKFNDLNKRYKRLNEILGRGTSCEVVENPALLDFMDHISEKAKEEVRKILNSKHLHYEQMCSYHNRNQLHLPPDPELRRSLHLALMPTDDHDESDVKMHLHNDNDEVEQEAECDGPDGSEFDDHRTHGFPGSSAKRVKQCQGHEEFRYRNSLKSPDCNKMFNFQVQNADGKQNQVLSERTKTNMLQTQWMNHRNLQLEEQKLHIQVQRLELEKEQFEWLKFCRKKDRELEAMKMEIESMKLENEQMAMELRRREMGIDNS